MDTSVFARIRFKEAFRGVSKVDIIDSDEDYLNDLCEQSSRSQVFVYDDPGCGHSIFVLDTNGLGRDKVLRLTNPNHRDLFLLHIDGVLFKKDSKCDCALLSEKELLFVEFKSDAANREERTCVENYLKCYSQLYISVEEFRERFNAVDVDLLNSFESVFAYAVFNPTVPKVGNTQQNLSAKFLFATGIKLVFDNQKSLV